MLKDEVQKENAVGHTCVRSLFERYVKDLTFKPAISETSRVIVDMRGERQNFSERLNNDAHNTAERKLQLVEAWQKKVRDPRRKSETISRFT